MRSPVFTPIGTLSRTNPQRRRGALYKNDHQRVINEGLNNKCRSFISFALHKVFLLLFSTRWSVPVVYEAGNQSNRRSRFYVSVP